MTVSWAGESGWNTSCSCQGLRAAALGETTVCMNAEAILGVAVAVLLCSIAPGILWSRTKRLVEQEDVLYECALMRNGGFDSDEIVEEDMKPGSVWTPLNER